MKKVYPAKLKKGDKIAIIAPSMSSSILSEETKEIANKRFSELGLTLVFGQHVTDEDEFLSSSIENRINDIHWAFSDKTIKAIITVIGGFNSNQLLKYIDWEIIKNNPKVFCGYSDITILHNAIFEKTGLVTYLGPHYSTFGQRLYFDYILDYFYKCLFLEDEFEIGASENWSDDAWYVNQADRQLITNDGYYMLNSGEAQGTILGGNLVSFRSLQGTAYFPDLKNSILCIEEDIESKPHHFDRDLQSLILLDAFKEVKALLIGRFQKNSEMTITLLQHIIDSKIELKKIPIIANVDFGHTSPLITLPIGGEIKLKASQSETKLFITKH